MSQSCKEETKTIRLAKTKINMKSTRQAITDVLVKQVKFEMACLGGEETKTGKTF